MTLASAIGGLGRRFRLLDLHFQLRRALSLETTLPVRLRLPLADCLAPR